MDRRHSKGIRVALGVVLFASAHACSSNSDSTPNGASTGTNGTPTGTGQGGAAGSASSGTGTGGLAGGAGSGIGTGGSGSGTAGSSSGTAGSGSGTAGSGGQGGTGPGSGAKVNVPPGEPIVATPMTWTAVPVTGSVCRDGRPTGFGVNVATASTKLLIFLEGGGACFNATTCLQAPSAWAATDANLNTAVGRNALFNRTGTSPFKDWNFVYIPYCSGDTFTGTTMSGYMGQPQMGYSNYFKFLQRIIATFKGLTQVVLSGSSAGGFGIAYNWMVTEDAFGDVPVLALDDSGPPMGPDYLSSCQEQRVGQLWGWAQSIHPACTDCDVAAGKVSRPLIVASLARASKSRFALTSYDEDGVIKSFFGYGSNNCAGWNSPLPPAYPAGKYPMGLNELRQTWADAPQVAMYVVKGGGHTFLAGDLARIQASATSVTMLDWVKQFADNAPGWSNVVP